MKKVFYIIPISIRRLIVRSIENVAFRFTKNVGNPSLLTPQRRRDDKKNILIYHASALSFGGTEKNLQMIAKYLNKGKFNVFLMDGTKTQETRLSYLAHTQVEIIPFTYSHVAPRWPYVLHDMNPLLEKVVQEKNIDCIITATPGQTTYPLTNIRDIPIIILNIFGSFSLQKNIKKHICISHEVKKLAARVVPEELLDVQYIPSERPLLEPVRAQLIRTKFGIKEHELVFGRIGRSDDSIFDPIGILAFEIALQAKPNIHYIIMSPAPAAKKLVEERRIRNVHWLDASFKEEDIWAFHEAIDVLAHFRADGESCGLNIIESMLVGNPILTHKSNIWNAHLEYLDPEFSLVAEKDDYKQYGENIIEYTKLHQLGLLKDTGALAKEKAEKIFLIENVMPKYERIIHEAMK